jgi:hemoglobin
MVNFWSTIILASSSFQGKVYGKHMLLTGVTPSHFRRWLSLYEIETNRLFAHDDAAKFQTVARHIGASLQYGFFGEVLTA